MSVNDALEREQKLDLLRQNVSERERELAALQQTLGEQEVAVAHLKREVAKREQALSALQESLGRHDGLQAALAEEQTVAELEEKRAYAIALTLVNAAYDALLVVDEHMRILASNSSADTLFQNEQLVGRPLSEATRLPELEMMVEDALAYEEDFYEEQIVYQKHFYRVRSQVIRRDGQVFIGLALQDVSELVRLNRARRDMVANISHELRTPIANIRLIIDGLFHEQEKPKRKESTSALKDIARETESLLWLVQELLDLSMIESGQAILRMTEEPLREIVAEAIERVEDQSDAKDIQIRNEVLPELMVLTDRDQVRRVLINLIHNAIKWSPPSEKIRVRASSDGSEVTVSVLDNGPGVPEEHRERIFERFYQVDPSRSGNEGTGLGLAICKHIVEAHGGRIWAEDNLEGKNGKGGCFKFTLPTPEANV